MFFITHSTQPTECWLWKGRPNNSGYGSTTHNGKRIGAHRLAYRIAYGPFDESLFVLHKCDTPLCVRPDHLFLGTQSDNMADCAKKGRNKTQYRWTSKDNPNTGKPMPPEKRAAVSRWKQKPFSLVDPAGQVIHGTNLRQFCKDRGLNQGGMWSVLFGSKPHHKGYTKVPDATRE